MQRAFRPLSFKINDETFLTSASPFDSVNRQCGKGLAQRAVSGKPFGGLNIVLAGDVLQHKPVEGQP
eukprot:scaffold260091_cov14-Prasinocladus_malaysianus.AAC.1